MIPPTTRFHAGPEVIACTFGEGLALLDLRSGTYFSVNSVGAFVWELLGKPIAVADIRRAILQRYDATVEQCANDLQALLSDMTEAKLIEASHAAAV